MDELIKLLREYKPSEYDYVEHDGGIFNRETDSTGEYNRYFDLEPVIISKKFWFIKWLFDNGKIDFDKIQIWFQLTLWYWKYDSLIMVLAVQDKPIEYLVSILK